MSFAPQRRLAMVVGIDGYPDQPLSGCCADARGLAALLARNDDGSLNWSVETVLGRSARVPVVSSRALAGRLQHHFAQAEDADLLLYFSGHAVRSPLGVELCTQDGVAPFLGIPLSTIMHLIEGACREQARSVTVILDCCFAGDLGSEVIGEGTSTLAVSRLPDNVLVLASSKPTQPSTQGAAHSPFSRLLIDGLSGAASDLEGAVTALSLFQFAHRAAPARGPYPQLRASCELVPILREASPLLSLAQLLTVRELFEEVDSQQELDRSWEWDGAPRTEGADSARLRAEALWELGNAGLVEPIPRAALHWLAINGGKVKLTGRGTYYWRLIQEGKI